MSAAVTATAKNESIVIDSLSVWLRAGDARVAAPGTGASLLLPFDLVRETDVRIVASTRPLHIPRRG